MGNEIDLLVCDLLLPLYQAAREVSAEEFQGLLLELVQEVVRFDSARWGTALSTGSGIEIRSQYLWRESEAVATDYAAVQEQDLLAKAATTGNGATVSATTSECFRERRFAGIREYTLRHEHRNSLLSATREHDAAIMHWLSLYRAREKDTFTPRDRNIVQQLVPHFREALAINMEMHLARLKQGQTKVACAVADREGLLHHAEAEFLAMLAEEYPGLRCAGLPERIIGALQGTGRYLGHAVAIESQACGGLLFLRARLASLADRLSPREMEVARLAAGGLSHKEIARHLGLSPATTRTHLQHIHDKLATHSLVEIANRLREIEP